MTQSMFLKDAPIDEKRISFIETVVSRLALRPTKKVTSLITPYPISNAVFGDNIRGPILCYMFPCEGTITKCLVDIGKKPKSEVTISANLKNQTYNNLRAYTLNRKDLLFEPRVDVHSGDQLVVSIEPNEEEKITEAWVSFLWVPAIKEVEAKSYLISELEKDEVDNASSI